MNIDEKRVGIIIRWFKEYKINFLKIQLKKKKKDSFEPSITLILRAATPKQAGVAEPPSKTDGEVMPPKLLGVVKPIFSLFSFPKLQIEKGK
jgi:hypothetical protein